MKVKSFYKDIFILSTYFLISLILFFLYQKMQSSIVENYCSRMIVQINDEKNEKKKRDRTTGDGLGLDFGFGFGFGSGATTDTAIGNVNTGGDTASTNIVTKPEDYCPVSITRDRWDYSLTYTNKLGEKKRYRDVDSYTTAFVQLQKDKKIQCPEVYIM